MHRYSPVSTTSSRAGDPAGRSVLVDRRPAASGTGVEDGAGVGRLTPALPDRHPVLLRWHREAELRLAAGRTAAALALLAHRHRTDGHHLDHGVGGVVHDVRRSRARPGGGLAAAVPADAPGGVRRRHLLPPAQRLAVRALHLPLADDCGNDDLLRPLLARGPGPAVLARAARCGDPTACRADVDRDGRRRSTPCGSARRRGSSRWSSRSVADGAAVRVRCPAEPAKMSG